MLIVKLKLLAVLIVQVSYWTLIIGCSDIHLEEQTVAERAKQASIIVFAEADHKYPEYSHNNEETYTMRFRHICILKNEEHFFGNLDEATLKRNQGYYFNVTQLGFTYGWCLQVDAIPGKKYYAFLRLDDKINTFVVDRINMQTPIFDDNQENKINLEEYLHDKNCEPTFPTQTTSTEPKMKKTSTMSSMTKTVKFVPVTPALTNPQSQSTTKLSHSEFVAKPRVSLTDKPSTTSFVPNTTSTGSSAGLQPLNWFWISLTAFLVYQVNNIQTAAL